MGTDRRYQRGERGRGILERLPPGVPDTWCTRMVITRKKNGEPRRTVDLAKLTKAGVYFHGRALRFRHLLPPTHVECATLEVFFYVVFQSQSVLHCGLEWDLLWRLDLLSGWTRAFESVVLVVHNDFIYICVL